jgi:formylglycine-generating enzyme required for sulfatase activity
MPSDRDVSLSDEATFAGRPRPQRSDVSLGDERTLGDATSGQDMIIDDIEVVDLEARYRMEGTLGQGGMGAVLLATDTRLDRKVAIKRILGDAAGNRMAVNRFLTEAKSIAAINHPNIVQIYDYGRAKDGPFLIMEYVDGGSLLDRCRDGAIPLESAVDLACQLCDGLAKAHDLGIIHRDIKPANVLLTKDGIPKLTDFGLAKAQASDHGQTMTGAVLGTPDFMPPEQRRDASLVDHRSDLWSVAATVYQMVTGRSPKIIRFDLLPAELTKVLGKALEDAKDDRYQTARELRDSLKACLRAATADAPATAEGQCPSCGVQNDASRRFCRGCGGSLEIPCLSCDKPMPIGEEICGSCGSKQTPLLEARCAAMAAEQAKAEGLLGDFAFDEASRIAMRLRDEPHPRLSHLNAWAEAFLGEVGKSRSHQADRAAESLFEASKHEEASDYLSAIFALESVPPAMRSVLLPGARETVDKVLDRLKKTQAEARRLESLVKERLAAKSLDGLLVEVERLLRLQPDRSDLQKLKAQLLDRQSRQAASRDKAVASATALLDDHDYEAALATLSAVPSSARSAEITSLLKRASTLVAEVRGLATKIREAVATKQFDGLFETIDAYLQLKPADPDVLKLRQSLVARDEKFAAEIAARLQQAETLEHACRFGDAAKILEAIPEQRRNEAVIESLNRCQTAATERSGVIKALAAAKPGEYAAAIEPAGRYQELLAAAGLDDAEFNRVLDTVKAGQAADERGRRQRRTFTIAATAVAVLALLVGSGFWIRSSQRAASLATALKNAHWDDALAIDPSNADAFLGRARAKLAARPPDIEGAFEDIERAGKRPRASTVVQATRAAAHAARAADHAWGDRLAEAARELAEATGLNADEQSLAFARAEIAAAWLARAEKAASKADATGLRAACDAAMKAGAPAEAVTPLRTRLKVLEALGIWKRGDSQQAVVKAIEAMHTDGTLASQALLSPEAKVIVEPVVREYRKQFNSAVASGGWDEAAVVAKAAQLLDPQAGSWLSLASSLPPDTLTAVPPATLTAVPPATLTAVPPATFTAVPPIRNSIGVDLKLIAPGRFAMGDAGRDSNEKPHEVTLTKPFYLGVYEVTNAQWRRVMGSVPSTWQDGDRPVERVSWDDTVEFCRKLSAVPGEQAAGRTYRLPTEAEWEYACRAGTTTVFSFGDDEKLLGDFGWFDGNAGSQTHPVGLKKPNGLGLHDMHGNVWEWCSDWYGRDLNGGVTDPQGPARGSTRVRRGGSWSYSAGLCRSAFRVGLDSSSRHNFLGFRLAMTATVADVSKSQPGPAAQALPPQSDAIDWIVVFRSSNPLDWGKPVGVADDVTKNYARAANDFPRTIRYVRLKRIDTQQSVILPVRGEWLTERHDEGRYRWQPLIKQTPGSSAGHCLGIVDSLLQPLTDANIGAIGVGIIPNVGWHSGWGFGEVWFRHQQGYAWAGQPIGQTMFEIAVKERELSPDEKQLLLD